MKKRTFTACATALYLAGMANTYAEGTKPNIIFIMADDLGYGDLSCNNPESKIYTPHIDSLANHGIRFTDAHSGAALSTPTRYGVLTGRYSFRSRLQSGVLGAEAEPLIEEDRMTVGKLLQQNGYNTACFGKWHLGLDFPKDNKGNVNYAGKFQNGPVTRGFDYYYGVNVNNSTFFIENNMAVEVPSVPKPDGMWGDPGLMAPGWTFENIMPTLKDKAIDYIKNTSGKRDSDKPFFIYFAATTPHTPIAPTEQFIGTSKAHRIGDFVQQLDWEVGQIMEALKEEGLDQNTLIIFTSDNGPMHWDGSNMQGGLNSIFRHGHNPSYIFRGKKSDVWEAGHRIPFVAYWPGQIPANTVSDEIISLVDLMGTCAGIVGTELPQGVGEDSYNILPALKAENTTPVRKVLLNYSGGGGFALRQGNWKFIDAGGSRGFSAPKTDADAAALGLPLIQLYNLADDPAEENNLQAEYPEKVKEMTVLLDSIRYGRITLTDVEDFEQIRNNHTGKFYLGADIMIPEGTEWIPLGAKNATDNNPIAFEGTLDGCGYSIKNLTITSQGNFKGLFGRLKHATVKNLELEVNITGGSYTGGVAGAMFAESTVERVSVSGSIQGVDEVGGIAGRVSFDPNYTEYNTIRDCYVEADVAAIGNNAGGIVGFSRKNGTTTFGKIDISNVYTRGRVSAPFGGSTKGNVAGLLAYTEHKFVKLNNSAVLCPEITGSTPNYFYSRDIAVGQFDLLRNLYADENINLMYFNNSDKGNGADIDMTGKLLASTVFKTKDFYKHTLGWNFDEIWYMTEGQYPKLKMQDPPPGMSLWPRTDEKTGCNVYSQAGGIVIDPFSGRSVAVSIYNLSGRKLYDMKQVDSGILVPLDKGSYIVRIVSDDRINGTVAVAL